MDLEERVARLERLLGANGITTADGKALSGEDAMAWLDGQQMSIYAGLANTQAAVGQLASATTAAVQAAGAPAAAVAAFEGVMPQLNMPGLP
jgi:hypothetical protein